MYMKVRVKDNTGLHFKLTKIY